MRTPARNRMAIAAHTDQPCLWFLTMRPKYQVRPLGIKKIERIWRKLDRGVGFSYGWAAFAFVYPPPLVPNILIATCEAIGPCTMVCDSTVVGSTSRALSYGLKFWIIPWETRKAA